jgi:hypothetical protein
MFLILSRFTAPRPFSDFCRSVSILYYLAYGGKVSDFFKLRLNNQIIMGDANLKTAVHLLFWTDPFLTFDLKNHPCIIEWGGVREEERMRKNMNIKHFPHFLSTCY